MLLVCYNLPNSQNIPINQYSSEKLLVTRILFTQLKSSEKIAITGLWWVLSTMAVRKQLGWGISSEPKAQSSQQHF